MASPQLGNARHAEAPPMIARRVLAKGVAEVSRLGLAGSYGIDATSVERAFHELAINYFFVTSRMKGMVAGISNLVRAGYRDRIVIASGASIPFGASVAWEWRHIAKKLGVDAIDVFHLFWVQAHWYVAGKTWPVFERLKNEGKIRALAISCHDRPMARRLVDELGLDVLMIRYNAAHRGAESEIFATLPERDRPGIVAYTATRWGKLLKPLGEHSAMTAAECYRFALGQPNVDVVLSGAANFAELEENAIGVRLGPLDPARLDEVKRFGDAVRATASGRIGFLGK